MDHPTLRLKLSRFLVFGLMVCVVAAFAEGMRDKVDTKVPILAQHIKFTEQGRFSKVGIGLPKEHDITKELEVNGTILAEEILVQAKVADYVFAPTYELKPLEYVEDFINQHHHLPGIHSESAVSAAGGKIPVGESYRALLEKIEELTLYTIEQNKRISALEKTIIRRNYSVKN